MNYYKSPLIYQGNKYEILDWLFSKFPAKESFGFFLDLFGGSSVVSLNVALKYNCKIVYTDANYYVATLLHTLLNSEYEYIYTIVTQTIKEFGLENYRTKEEWMKMSKEEKEETTKPFYNARNLLNKLKETTDEKEWIIKAYTLSLFAFSDKFEFNKEGNFVSSAGVNYGWREKLLRISNYKRILQYVGGKPTEIKHDHYLNQLNQIIGTTKYGFSSLQRGIEFNKENYFVYLDPPYFGTEANYNKYWNEAEENRLLDTLLKLDKYGIKFAMSNTNNEHLYEFANKHGFKIFEREHLYKLGGGTKKAIEILMVNYETEPEIKQISLFE